METTNGKGYPYRADNLVNSFQNSITQDTENTVNSQELNPQFDDLSNPATIINHLEQLVENGQNPFPVEVFPKRIQGIITATNESLKFPIDFIAASILFAASVSIGNTYRVEVTRGWQENATLYLALVGLPGTNKTHPLKWATKPIVQRDNQNFQKHEKEKQEYEKISSLTKKEREQQGYSEPVKPIWKQSLVSDITPEALVSVHSFNKRGLGVSVDELASWFKNFNRYNKGSEQEFWLSVWSGNTVKVNRKTSESYNIPLPFISVAGTIQPGVLNELAKDRTENGFLDRILFVVPDNLKKEYWSEKELSPEIYEGWQTTISNLLDFPITQDDTNNPQPETLRFTPEAHRLLFEWQRELTDQSNNPENEAISGINAKLEMYAIRFSLILQLLNGACSFGFDQAIEVEAVRGALKLVKYFKKAAVKVRSIVSNANPQDNLPTDNQALYAALPDTFTTSEGVEIAKRMGMPERTFKRFVTKKELFIKTKQGEYEKLS